MTENAIDWTALVDVLALAAAIGDPALRIVDARFALAEPDAGRQGYVESHLPGAVYADLNRDLSDPSRSSALGRHPLPDSDAFVAALGRWGIAPGSQVVIYDAADGSMAAARLWWMLRLLGHRRVAVLDGGLAAWRAAGLPETASTAEVPAAVAAYPSRFDLAAVVASEDVLARLGQRPGWLLDARAGERFRGEVEPIDPVAGHVPGAVNRPLGLNLKDGRFRPAAELSAELLPLLQGTAPADVVVMCGSGITACHLLLALEVAGLAGARVYAASWSGWIDDRSHPFSLRGVG